jgi:hypothetical protein
VAPTTPPAAAPAVPRDLGPEWVEGTPTAVKGLAGFRVSVPHKSPTSGELGPQGSAMWSAATGDRQSE